MYFNFFRKYGKVLSHAYKRCKKKSFLILLLSIAAFITLLVLAFYMKYYSSYKNSIHEDIINNKPVTDEISKEKLKEVTVTVDTLISKISGISKTTFLKAKPSNTNLGTISSNDIDINKVKPNDINLTIDKLFNIRAREIFGNIKGKYSISFKDLNTGNLILINDNKFVAASTIKIFIMIEAFDRIKSGLLNENDSIVLQTRMKVGGSGVLSSKPDGTIISISDLIFLMMTKSDNTATNILIEKLGMQSINDKIKAFGCTNTVLNRTMMDQSSINKGIQNYTSPRDLTIILSKIYSGECLGKVYDNKMLDIMKKNQHKGKIPKKLPANVVVANKTGELNGIENDAAIIFTTKGNYILCITTSNGNSTSQTIAINDFSKFVYENYIESN